ncbi:hypothetical protein BV20DRAFT_978349 [Pilatotrama ljubarskyi]|nr:hypothetical protein BV20DRAFT_978349 [Pilatotrama ljubarskyi]
MKKRRRRTVAASNEPRKHRVITQTPYSLAASFCSSTSESSSPYGRHFHHRAPALAADCYTAGGCEQCESHDSIESAHSIFCNTDKWSNPSSLTWGVAHVTLDGQFSSQQQCGDGFQTIIDQCSGHKDGGIHHFKFNGNDARLDVDFCNCECVGSPLGQERRCLLVEFSSVKLQSRALNWRCYDPAARTPEEH